LGAIISPSWHKYKAFLFRSMLLSRSRTLTNRSASSHSESQPTLRPTKEQSTSHPQQSSHKDKPTPIRTMSYTESRRYYTQKPLVTYARESSADSRASASTRSSGEGYYTSSRTSTSMANSDYTASSQSGSTDSARSVSRRVPDNGLSPLSITPSLSSLRRTTANNTPPPAGYYITSTTSSNGKVETHNHGKPRYDPAEPRAKEARYEEYNRAVDSRRTQDRISQSYRS
jgi:hypothetical protein